MTFITLLCPVETDTCQKTYFELAAIPTSFSAIQVDALIQSTASLSALFILSAWEAAFHCTVPTHRHREKEQAQNFQMLQTKIIEGKSSISFDSINHIKLVSFGSFHQIECKMYLLYYTKLNKSPGFLMEKTLYFPFFFFIFPQKTNQILI